MHLQLLPARYARSLLFLAILNYRYISTNLHKPLTNYTSRSSLVLVVFKFIANLQSRR